MRHFKNIKVASFVVTVLTVYGIETLSGLTRPRNMHKVATAPTVYGMRRRVRGSRGAKRR